MIWESLTYLKLGREKIYIWNWDDASVLRFLIHLLSPSNQFCTRSRGNCGFSIFDLWNWKFSAIIRVTNHRKFFTWWCQTESTKSLELGWLILILFNKLSFQISQAPLIQPWAPIFYVVSPKRLSLYAILFLCWSKYLVSEIRSWEISSWKKVTLPSKSGWPTTGHL